jgi:NAD-dependent SIR2 family protein deacetylase
MTRKVDWTHGLAECTKCYQWKPFSDFYKASNSFGMTARCKACERDYKDVRRGLVDVTEPNEADIAALTAPLGWRPMGPPTTDPNS